MKNQNDLIERYLKKLNNATGMSNVKQNLEDNKIYFDYKDKEYRVRMPKYGERKVIDKAKKEFYLELVDKKVPFEITLIEQLNANNNNFIRNLEKQIGSLQVDKERYQELLFKETNPDEKKEDKKRINELIAEIEKITYQQVNLSLMKIDKLSSCVEYQILDKELELAIHFLFEVKKDEEWLRVYDTVELLNEEEDKTLLDNAAEMLKNLGVVNG